LSEAPEASRITATSKGRAPVSFSLEWITRPVFAVLLGGLAIFALYQGGLIFAAFIALVVTTAAREWHRMIAQTRFVEEFLLTSLIVIAAAYTAVMMPHSVWPWLLVLGGAVLSFLLAKLRHRRALWEAAGVLYLGIPALCIVLLRIVPAEGFNLLLAFFIAIWATDTGALIFGKLIGGPKFSPILSPNKTWAGFLGGIVLAALVGGVAFALLQLNAERGALFAAAIAVIAHLGDLLESAIKRNFRIKNSGGLIPGHGGVLDRIDSTLLAAPVLAAAVFLAGINPMVLS